MLWSQEEHDYLLYCFKGSSSVQQAVGLFRDRYPQKSYDGIKRFLDRHYQKPMSAFLGISYDKPVNLKNDNQNSTVNLKVDIKPEPPLSTEDKIQIHRLRKEIVSLKNDLNEALKSAATSDSLRHLIHEISSSELNTNPKWVIEKKIAHTKGIPSLFLSDLHYDETVIKEQVNGLNEYNHDIAAKRLEYTFKEAVRYWKTEFNNPVYDGFHLILNGDIFSGNIHEELRETNHQPILRSVVDLEELLIKGIDLLVAEFGKVFITCACGNHSRIDKKPRAKNRVFDNYEWLLYQHLAKAYRGIEQVNFLIPDSYEYTFEIYKKRFLQTHGDVFKGGGGIGGILVPILRGLSKRAQNYSSVGKPFDTMIIGHFHQEIFLEYLIINGCFPGNSKVLTPDMFKSIESFKKGDKVISRDGSIQEVKHVFKKRSEDGLVHLKVRGLCEPLSCTPNHLIWAMKDETVGCPTIGIKWHKLSGAGDKPQWIPADFLSPGDWVHIPIPKGSDKPITEEDAWFFGLFLAEGCSILNAGKSKLHHRISLTMHKREIGILEKWADIFYKKFGKRPKVFLRKNRNTSDLVVSPGYDVCKLFRDLFGHKASGKIVPPFIMTASPEIKKALVDGWVLGDGHTTKSGTKSATTISKTLAFQMFQLSLSAGMLPSMSMLSKCNSRKSDSYTIHFNNGQESKVVNGELFYRVHARYRDRQVIDVYDLEITGEHTYCVNNIGVHNSMKGFDEWTSGMGFQFEKPKQVMWLNNPEHGIAMNTRVVCDYYLSE